MLQYVSFYMVKQQSIFILYVVLHSLSACEILWTRIHNYLNIFHIQCHPHCQASNTMVVH